MPTSLHWSAWHRAYSDADTQNKDKHILVILFEVLYKWTKDWQIIIDTVVIYSIFHLARVTALFPICKSFYQIRARLMENNVFYSWENAS